MGLFSKTARWLGLVSVKETNNVVRISGIDGFVMGRYIKQAFETDVLTKHMFISITDTSMSLSSFFLPDLIYILHGIKHNPKCGWSGKRTVDKILHGININTWWKTTFGEVEQIIDLKRLNLIKWKPLTHQVEFLQAFGDRMPRYGLRGILLAALPGSGKTAVDLMVTTCMVPPSVAEVKIIISPKKALHQVWEKTIDVIFKKRPAFWVCDSGLPMSMTGYEYYIFNYEKLEEAIKLGQYLALNKKRFFVSIDESHNFADPKSARTQRLVTLCNTTKNTYSIWMSGSPILKSGAELVSFLEVADNRFDADAKRRFTRIFSASPGRAATIFNHRLGKFNAFIPEKIETNVLKPIIKELPVKLPPNLANRFLMTTVRAEMKDFIAERLKFYGPKMNDYRKYVDKVFSTHEHTLKTRGERILFEQYKMNVKIISKSPDVMLPEIMAAARAYERSKLLPSMPPHERKEFRKVLSAIKNIKLKVRGEALGTVLSRRRAECAAALGIYCKPEILIKESNSKTLFFAASVLPIKAVEDYLKKKGFQPMLVYADTNKYLNQIINEFDNNPDANPICATFKSLSEAVPVTSASTVVFLNRPFRIALREQVIARSARLGQLHQVVVWDITLDTGDEPNVSSTTDAILSAIRDDINLLVGSDFAGPDPSETQLAELIDQSKEDPNLLRSDELIGIM